MRKFLLYFKITWFTVFLVIIAVCVWFFVTDSIGTLKATLIGALLGFGLTTSVARNIDSLTLHRRRKRTFGMIKLIVIPYLLSRAQNLLDTMRSYHDISSTEEALTFIMVTSHLDILASTLDKEWTQLIYSQDFLDAINSDNHFNSIATAVKEVMFCVDQLASQSIDAKSLNVVESQLTPDHRTMIISRAREMRDVLEDNALKLEKYVNQLDRDVSDFLSNNGTSYEEYDR
jgi:hypothetical protein